MNGTRKILATCHVPTISTEIGRSVNKKNNKRSVLAKLGDSYRPTDRVSCLAWLEYKMVKIFCQALSCKRKIFLRDKLFSLLPKITEQNKSRCRVQVAKDQTLILSVEEPRNSVKQRQRCFTG